MAYENYNQAAYNGTKNFSQQDVHSANATGFGAAADDYSERGIDLNEQLIYNKTATFFFKMNSEAMLGCGIQNGDLLTVDRSLTAANGKIVVAVVNGEIYVRRVLKTFNKLILVAESNGFANIEVDEFAEYRCWGVVTCVIHIFEQVLKKAEPKAKAERNKA